MATYTYIFNNSHRRATITSVTLNGTTDLIIPSTVTNDGTVYTINHIDGSGGTFDNLSLQSLEVTAGIAIIANAFNNCTYEGAGLTFDYSTDYTFTQSINGTSFSNSPTLAKIGVLVPNYTTLDPSSQFVGSGITNQGPSGPEFVFWGNPYAQVLKCFPTGTRILVKPNTYVPIETLTNSDTVMTADGRSVPIKLYKKTILKTTDATAPYVIPAKLFGNKEELHLSPLHAFQIRRGLWQIPKYVARLTDRVYQYALGQSVTYYHIECPNFFTDNLVADGCVVESYGENQVKGLKTLYKYNHGLRGFTRAAKPLTSHLIL